MLTLKIFILFLFVNFSRSELRTRRRGRQRNDFDEQNPTVVNNYQNIRESQGNQNVDRNYPRDGSNNYRQLPEIQGNLNSNVYNVDRPYRNDGRNNQDQVEIQTDQNSKIYYASSGTGVSKSGTAANTARDYNNFQNNREQEENQSNQSSKVYYASSGTGVSKSGTAENAARDQNNREQNQNGQNSTVYYASSGIKVVEVDEGRNPTEESNYNGKKFQNNGEQSEILGNQNSNVYYVTNGLEGSKYEGGNSPKNTHNGYRRDFQDNQDTGNNQNSKVHYVPISTGGSQRNERENTTENTYNYNRENFTGSQNSQNEYVPNISQGSQRNNEGNPSETTNNKSQKDKDTQNNQNSELYFLANNSPEKSKGQNKNTEKDAASKADLLPGETCGLDSAQKRIIGGSSTNIDEFPWLTLLQYVDPSGKVSHDCSGVLISKRYVLTAAHCTHGLGITTRNMKLRRIRLGEWDISSTKDCQGDVCSAPLQEIDVEEIIPHEKYKPRQKSQANDISLIRLRSEANLNQFVQPICLPLGEIGKTNYEGKKLTVAGWGRTSNARDSSSDVKMKVFLPVVNQDTCRQFYQSFYGDVKISDSQFCAGGESGKDTCQGDSGGPLMTTEKGKSKIQWFVVGIVSSGPAACAVQDRPSLYTNVSQYTDWILNNMKS